MALCELVEAPLVLLKAQYNVVIGLLYTRVQVIYLFGHFLSFLCSLWVDVRVDHSSDWVRGVYDGVRNLVRVVPVFIT